MPNAFSTQLLSQKALAMDRGTSFRRPKLTLHGLRAIAKLPTLQPFSRFSQ